MKKITIGIAIAIALAVIAPISSYASLIDIGSSGEPAIYSIYNALYGTSYGSNDEIKAAENDAAIVSGLFKANNGQIHVVARYSAADITLKYYDSLGAHDIVAGLPAVGAFYGLPGISYTVTSNGAFSMSGEANFGANSLGTWYSNSSLNSDSKYHFLVLNTPDPNKWLVGFEDVSAGSDWDYNDIVFEVKDPPSPTPEPASLSLLGMGLFGLLRLRKNNKWVNGR